MERGKIVDYGPVSQVLREPAHPYTKALLACRLKALRPPRK
jgi:ABC-type dipeptide/oligopeptide/nickel transport system ATPase component